MSFVRVLVADKCAAVRGREQSGASVRNGRMCRNARRLKGQGEAEVGGGRQEAWRESGEEDSWTEREEGKRGRRRSDGGGRRVEEEEKPKVGEIRGRDSVHSHHFVTEQVEYKDLQFRTHRYQY